MSRDAGSVSVGSAAIIALVLAVGLAPAPALAQPRAQALPIGAVAGLAGTPHLWVADAQGILHWAGDTRALAGKAVDWNNRTDVALAQLQALTRGDPWLSAGLVKVGEPIYFAKWETNESRPRLLHIQSIADVELFGINAQNYGALVLDQ